MLTAFTLMGTIVSAQTANKTVQNPDHQISHKSIPNENGIIRCHTMEADSIMRQNNPSMPSLYAREFEFQRGMEEYQKQLNSGALAKKAVITIPIIFHILTDGSGAENISAAQVQAQLDQLNLDYANLSGSPYAVAADCELQFCLAAVDPGGAPLAEPGIDRVTSQGQGPFSMSSMDGGVKQATIWDPTQYCNIWVCNLSGGLLGYAQFPGGATNTDGVVILYTSVGSVANPFPGGAPYNLGRTLTHELGHWLNLYHVWGDGPCGTDDQCADTPKSDASNYGCPSTNSCTDAYTASSPWWPTADPKDMVENYMDYTDDDCMNTFTADQKARVQYTMATYTNRKTLGASTVCNAATDPDDAGIVSIVEPSGEICATSTDLIVKLQNYGTNDLTSVTITWDIDGGSSTVYNWTGTLASGSSVDVNLGNVSPSTGNHTFNVSTSSPNGNSDTNMSNDANSSNFSIVIGEAVTLTLSTDCWGEETVWELFDSGSSLVASGGNQNVTTPVTSSQSVNTSDPGAYGASVTIDEVWCLTPGECYDFVIYDAYGDGMYGSQYNGCSDDGNYTITDGGGATLASLQAANSDFGFSETANFCLANPCPPSYGTETVSACESYTWIDGNTYTASNNSATYTYVGGAASGCDSIVTLDLLINNVATGTDVITACESYTWIDGNTYTSSNNSATHTYVGGAVNGCDSIVTLNLTVNYTATGTDVIQSCAAITWIDGNTYSSSNNTATHTIVGGAANGCDSIVTLDFTLGTFVTGTDAQSACDTYTWIDGNTYTSSNNSAQYTYVNGAASGCDSIVTLNLTINSSYNLNESVTVCENEMITYADGASETITGNTSHTSNLTTAAGCDSVIVTTVTMNALPNVTLAGAATMCQQDGVVTLSGTPAGGTYSGPGVSGNQFDPSVAGAGFHTIVYSYTDGSTGCTNSDSQVFDVQNCASLEEEEFTNLSIYPNPSAGLFNIQLNGSDLIKSVTVVDVAGRKVFEMNEVNSNSLKLDLNTADSGTYLLNITTESSILTKRIVVRK